MQQKCRNPASCCQGTGCWLEQSFRFLWAIRNLQCCGCHVLKVLEEEYGHCGCQLIHEEQLQRKCLFLPSQMEENCHARAPTREGWTSAFKQICLRPQMGKNTPQTSWISCSKERLTVVPVRIFHGNVGKKDSALLDQELVPASAVSNGCEIRLFWERKFPPVPKVGRGLGKGAARRSWRWRIPGEWMSLKKQSRCLSWMLFYLFILMDILE